MLQSVQQRGKLCPVWVTAAPARCERCRAHRAVGAAPLSALQPPRRRADLRPSRCTEPAMAELRLQLVLRLGNP